MKNKASRLPYEMPQDPDWLFHQPNLSPEVINETMNMRTIRFSQHKSLNLRFTEKTRNNFKRGPFVSLEELYSYSFCFLEREENIFPLFVVFREREVKISLSGFQGENSHRERFHLERGKKTYLFIYLNSGGFLVVLKLPKIVPPFSPINWVGSIQPTWAPKPNSNISHLHKMG